MESSLQLALEQLDALPSSIRIVIIHSNYAQQRPVLARFLVDGGADALEQTIYLRLDGNAGDAQSLKNTFYTTLSQNRLTIATSNLVVLDDADRSDPTALVSLVRDLLQQSPVVRIVLLSREVLNVILSQPEFWAITVVLPARDPVLLWDYAQPVSGHILEVRAFGQGRVILDGQPIARWEGTLPRALFFFFIDRGMVTRDEIFSTFWPELSQVSATNVFHVTKHKIHQLLGGLELTQFSGGYYHIDPSITVAYDVFMFRKLLTDAETADEATRERLLEQALTLSRGIFLYTLEFEWIRARRAEFAAMRLETILTLARILETAGRSTEAVNWYSRAAFSNVEREDIVLRVMELYGSLGNPQDGLQIYARLRDRLAEAYQIAPGRAIEAMAAHLRRNLSEDGNRFSQDGQDSREDERGFSRNGHGAP